MKNIFKKIHIAEEKKLKNIAKKELAAIEKLGIEKAGFIDFSNTMNPISKSKAALLTFEKLFKKHYPEINIVKKPSFIGQNKDEEEIFSFEIDMSQIDNEEYKAVLQKIIKDF